ncbi:DMT family transporter [Rhodovulum sp. 12E13]|uniref:DMT family transporter n=1 Tax=Rhodovulum sp. 12E13 TaxID=2203891 RepID=UPI001F475B6F|nr:DMT family transporter [Rhodovulum sp. 12E13]
MSAVDAAARAARRDRAVLTGLLVLLGAGWGITQPMAKIAVSEGYRHVGIVFWQLVLSGAILGAICAARRLPPRWDAQAMRFYTGIALIGTLLPNGASYEAARHLPAGWLSITLSMVPLFAFPIALAWGIDRFHWPRFLGLMLGLVGVTFLALPVQAWLTGDAELGAVTLAMAVWLPLALVAPALYALEGNVVARFGTGGMDPVQLLFGASVVGALLALPATLATGTWIDPRPPWGAPDAAIVVASAVHALVYASYVWMVGRAGAVFAAQVSYLVTGFGVIWAMLLLGESYGAGFWIAMACMFAGLFLVQPRAREGDPLR